METIILLIIGGLILWGIIAEIIERKIKQPIKDRTAKEVLKDFDYQKERNKILAITKDFIKKEYRCPLCGGILVSRQGRFGQFWGCKNYPNCKFTKNRVNYGIL